MYAGLAGLSNNDEVLTEGHERPDAVYEIIVGLLEI